MKTEQDEPINPIHFVTKGQEHKSGLTKLEYFSAMALQGLAANSTIKLNELETCKVAVRLAKVLVGELNR